MDPELPQYKNLCLETTAEMLKDFRGERTGWVQVGPKKYLFPHRYTEQGEGFIRFKARPTDVWVLSYPRSGMYLFMQLRRSIEFCLFKLKKRAMRK